MISYSPDVTPDYNLGTKATYTCEAGFYLEGNEVQVCMDDDGMEAIGVWSGSAPVCQGKWNRFSIECMDSHTEIVACSDLTHSLCFM